ncbi:hypothetical protein MMC21_008423 [Puttea exsequens]|nr:hypothetical protein [Puttea exsequens]
MGQRTLRWGRKTEATWCTAFASLAIVVLCPVWIITNWIAVEHFNGSLQDMLSTALTNGPISLAVHFSPRPSTAALLGYGAWIVFQAALFTWLPGPISLGQLTPAGNLLKYRTNGLLAWSVTLAIELLAAVFGIIDLAVIANHWEGLLVVANAYGALLSVFCLIKAHLSPSHPGDRKFSGSLIFDFFVGIELNPRIGQMWDLKLFHNGRPGIIAWTLIDLSYTVSQYHHHGSISNSMLIVDLFHLIYVVDFFLNEDWYLRTIDMAHDHFGFYLAWGSVVVLPATYTVQVQYLARNPVLLSPTQVLAVLTLGLGGYALFRSANYQKDLVRSKNGECKIWGRQAEFIRCIYTTEDGRSHESLLLFSGTSPDPPFNSKKLHKS